jgi:hypothetical protein
MATAMKGRVVAGLAVLVALAMSGGCTTDPGITSPFFASTSIERKFIGAVTTWDLNRDGDVTCEEWKGAGGKPWAAFNVAVGTR